VARKVLIVFFLVLAVALVGTMAVFAADPVAAPAKAGGATWDTAQELQCDAPVMGKLMPGERRWFTFMPRSNVSPGRSEAVKAWLVDFDPPANDGNNLFFTFNVWTQIKRPFGLNMEIIGRGSEENRMYNLSSWRGTSDLGQRHWVEVINNTGQTVDFAIACDCRWPLSWDTPKICT
jgi:hypothetical protein